MKKLFAALFTLAALVVLAGCSAAPVRDDEGSVEILPAERLVNRLEANRRKVKNFTGTGTITVQSKEFDNSASFSVTLVKPDSIQVAIYGPFGIELAQMLVTKQEFRFYDGMRNTLYKGKASEGILRELFHVNLGFTQLLDAFLGAVNLSERLYKVPSDYAVISDKYIMTYADSLQGGSTRYRVNIKDLGIASYEIRDNNGAQLLEGNYYDFTITDGVAIPNRIEVLNSKEGQKLLIEYKSVAINQKGARVEFTVPDDADVVEW